MIWDIMYELPLFGEWRVVRSAGALLEVTHSRAPTGSCRRSTHEFLMYFLLPTHLARKTWENVTSVCIQFLRAKGVPMSQELEFFATCPKGFEKLLAQELDGLRIKKVRPLGGQVAFYGSLADAYRVCLWSRLTSRVILVLDRVGAATSDALYEDLSHIAWEDHIGPHATIAVSAHGTNDQLRNTNFIAVRTKDAIVDRLAAKRGSRPMVNTLAPDVTIVVRVSRNRATVGIDLAGEALFKRSLTGGRGPAREFAPLRLDYAAALLYLQAQTAASAPGFSPDVPLPALLFPGAGALAQEAAGMALDVAPGILRARWGMTGWAGHDDDAWQDLLVEADERAEKGQERQITLYAADPRPKAKEAVLYTLRAGGLKADVQFLAASELLKHAEHFTGIVADLSWTKEEPTLQGSAYATLGLFAGQASTLLTSDTNTDTVLRATPLQTLSVYVGNSIATMRSYPAAIVEEVEAGASDAPANNSEPSSVPAGPTVMVNNQPVSVLVPASDQFAARLTKVAKLRAKWARKNDVSCYRVYDADLPDYAVSIDIYKGATKPTTWLQISEYAASKEIDPDLAKRRLLDVLALAPRILGVPSSNVNLRTRTRAKGGSQYSDEGSAADNSRKEMLLIDEGGLLFEVNFASRLDCGIFLDHRDTRAEIRELMKSAGAAKSFLNLFAYTGTATCYAADGGALHSTTVDLSKPSLEWAKRNMKRNGFDGEEHEFVQADVLSWITEMRHTKNRWNVIFCDVPTFSNSSRMRQSSFDVQRDHAELIIGISRLLTRGGVAIFSCNLRTFKPDVEKIQRAGVIIEDITSETIPEDFSRNQKIHHAYKISRKPRENE